MVPAATKPHDKNIVTITVRHDEFAVTGTYCKITGIDKS